MSSTDIISKISAFNPSETVVLDFSVLKAKGIVVAAPGIPIAKDKNYIILLGGGFTGDYLLNFYSVPVLTSTEVEQEMMHTVEAETTLPAQDGITKALSIVKNAGVTINKDSNKVLVFYYPLMPGVPIDPRLSVTSDKTTTTVKTVNFDDLAVPDGKTMVMVLAKNTSTQNLAINISRPSYTSQICAACPTCSVPEGYCDNDGKISKNVFWGVTGGLIALLFFLMMICLCWVCSRSTAKTSTSMTEI